GKPERSTEKPISDEDGHLSLVSHDYRLHRGGTVATHARVDFGRTELERCRTLHLGRSILAHAQALRPWSANTRGSHECGRGRHIRSRHQDSWTDRWGWPAARVPTGVRSARGCTQTETLGGAAVRVVSPWLGP